MNGKKTFIIIANIFITLILIQTHVRPFTDMILSGAEKKAVILKASVTNCINGTCQNSIEQWLKQNIGFRGFFVKLDNQLNYSLFNEFSRHHPRKIILGNKNLYEEPYINNYNRLNVIPPKDLETKISSLKKLQSLLSGKNVKLLLLVTPSKATINPEYIPDRFIYHDNLLKTDNYQNMVQFLEKYGINYIDGRKMFLELKYKSVPQLFPTSGTHWSLYGGYLFTEKLVKRMEQLLGKRLVHIACRKLVPSREPIELDKDVARLANILFTRSLFTGYIYPDTYQDAPPGAYRPNILLIGSSFCWNIIYYLEMNRIFSRMDFYYYFNTDYSYPGKVQRHIDRVRVNWNRDVISRDILLIEINEVAISEIGYDFIEAALLEFGRQ